MVDPKKLRVVPHHTVGPNHRPTRYLNSCNQAQAINPTQALRSRPKYVASGHEDWAIGIFRCSFERSPHKDAYTWKWEFHRRLASGFFGKYRLPPDPSLTLDYSFQIPPPEQTNISDLQ